MEVALLYSFFCNWVMLFLPYIFDGTYGHAEKTDLLPLDGFLPGLGSWLDPPLLSQCLAVCNPLAVYINKERFTFAEAMAVLDGRSLSLMEQAKCEVFF